MVYKAIHYDHAPQSTKELLDFRNTRYDLRETDILKLPKVNTITYGLKSRRYLQCSTKAVEPATGIRHNYQNFHSLLKQH